MAKPPNIKRDTFISVKAGLIAACSAGIALFLLFYSTFWFSNLATFKIDAHDILVLPHEGDGPFRRKLVNEPEYTLYQSTKIPIKSRRQYTHTFKLTDLPAQDGTVFIPSTGGTVRMYMNGVSLGAETPLGVSVAGHGKNFVWQNIPAHTYQAGINRLIIVLSPDETYSGISHIYLRQEGGLNTAASLYIARNTIIRRSLIILGFSIMALAIMGLFSRFWIRGYGPLFLIGGGVMALGVSASPIFMMSRPPSGIFLALYVMISFSLLLISQSSPVKNRENLSKDALSVLIWGRPFLWGLWCLAFISALLAILLILPIPRPFWALYLAPLTEFGTIPFALFFGFKSVWADKRTAKTNQRDLENKITQQDAIIVKQQTAIEDVLKTAGRLEERQRLTRDIHDGIGGQLLSLLVRVKDGSMSQEQIENDLQYGLNDLRLIVDSMDHSESTIESAFVTFRARAKAQLLAANITLNWQQSEPLVPSYFGPSAILNIYRFMQESVSNVIRHSQCDQIKISITRVHINDDLIISVQDNGVGFASETPLKAGQGIKNMQFRAKSVGGALTISAGPENPSDSQNNNKGSEIKLTIPADKMRTNTAP